MVALDTEVKLLCINKIPLGSASPSLCNNPIPENLEQERVLVTREGKQQGVRFGFLNCLSTMHIARWLFHFLVSFPPSPLQHNLHSLCDKKGKQFRS